MIATLLELGGYATPAMVTAPKRLFCMVAFWASRTEMADYADALETDCSYAAALSYRPKHILYTLRPSDGTARVGVVCRATLGEGRGRGTDYFIAVARNNHLRCGEVARAQDETGSRRA